MNFIWLLMVISGLIILSITNPNLAFTSMLSGSEKAISLSIKLWAIYSLWLGILNIIEATELNKKISKLLNPIIKFLFGYINISAQNEIATNITSNLLGLGNASVPSGINAMKNLSKGETYITTSMLMLTILNTCNLQIIPSTIIGLRTLNKSINSTSIILPTIITSAVSLIVGIFLVKISSHIKFKKSKLNSKTI